MKVDFALRSLSGFLTGIGPDSLRLDRAATHTRVIRLKCDEVVKLEKSCGAARIKVKSGILWLKSTPAENDVLLQAGDTFELGDCWPYVVQALERNAAFTLKRTS